MSLVIIRDAKDPTGSPVTSLPAGEGNFFRSAVVTKGTKSVRVNSTYSGSRQVGKDGTIRSMLKVAAPLSLVGLVPTADPTKTSAPAGLTLHVVLAEDGRIAQLKDNPDFESLVLEIERQMVVDLCALLLGSNAGPTTSFDVPVDGGADMLALQRLARGSQPFVDGDSFGGANQ